MTGEKELGLHFSAPARKFFYITGVYHGMSKSM